MPAQTKNTCSRTFFGTERGVPFCPVPYDCRKGRKCFTIVDDRWPAIKSDCCWEWWLQSWIPAPALQRLHQCAFFSADIRACPTMQNDIERIITAQYILANVTSSVCFFNGAFYL